MSRPSPVHPAPPLLPRGGTRSPRALQVSAFRCEPLDDMEPQALGFTYWFETEREGEPYSVSVRFVGRRIGVKGRPGRRDRFDVVETVERVVPGSGPVAVTKRVFDVAPGEWHVTAAPTTETRRRGTRNGPSRGHARLTNASSSGTTAYAPVIRVSAPGARLGAWPSLVAVGVVVALSTQQVLARHRNLAAGRVLLVSLLASVVGLVAAKAYYLVEHRGEHTPVLTTAGLCIQGFVLGAIATLAAGAAVAGVPVGPALDVTTPGLLFAMTIGRFGCFFGGCCAGRPTGSRWGLWSSDRRVGMRRIPTQLLESALAFTVGAASVAVVWSTTPSPAGVVFVAAIAAYTAGRQLLFPLRDLPRHTANGRTLTLALAVTVAVAAVLVGVLA